MKFRDLQAAACVALMLSSAVAQTPAAPAPGQAPATTQQPADSQQQLAPQQQPAAANSNAAGETPAAQQPAGTVNPTAPAPQQGVQNDTTGTPGLPQAPAPKLTEPLYLRPTGKDYTEPIPFLPNPLHDYTPTNYPAPRLSNTPDLRDLLRDGKIFLGLNDAVTLALENNYDIAIARINLDIADTDILRAKAGSSLRGVSTGIVANTLGGSSSTITGGGGPGGTTSAAGGSGAGASGLVLSTNGGGPVPELLDPEFTGTLQYERANTQESSTILTGTNTLSQNTGTYDFQYQEGFIGGESLNVTFDNSHVTTNSERTSYSPLLQSSFRAQLTQHLLQGCCKWVNERFIIQAKNDRRITDSAFRQQLIYTIGQVESIYWALVSAYEDEQAKERALQQSTQLASDNRKQLQIGTLAPLDVVNSDAAVASDKQALITSQSNLEYQQLLMKQAIVRNLNDPQMANAPVIPTDRVSLDRLPEEDMQTEDLIREAYQNNPQIEQATLAMKNNEITIRAEKNGLLPVLDAYGFYGGSGVGGQQNPDLNCGGLTGTPTPCPPGTVSNSGYGSVLGNTLKNSSPDWGVGVNLQIPIRNRIAQADQVRSQMEYRQSQMRLQQLYTQIRIQVINGVYALTNDRAAVQSSQSARDYAAQALEAEQKKYRLGASTTANVLQMERNLATAEDNMISATAAYARDRASLGQILASTLDKYGISITQAANGTISQKPNIPGLTAPTPPAPPKPLTETPPPMPQ
ncbi:MAG TPA: TolC family protein [Acidobacteriaceae bacterium]|nr:TolC family protein [Acidobacteriaceae bacterium]